MHAIEKHELAIRLRKAGYAYSYISQKTGLSKGTLSGWLGEIPYTPNKETTDRVGKAIAAANEKKTQLKQQGIKEIRKKATQDIGSLSKRDLFMFGLGLYLGEGSKTGDLVRLVNSDPNVIRLAIAWFHGLGVFHSQFLIKLYLYPDSNVEKSLQFWSSATTIPRGQFSKVYIDVRTNKRKDRAGKLPHGTAHLSVRGLGRKEFGVVLARKIQAWTDTVVQVVNKRRD